MDLADRRGTLLDLRFEDSLGAEQRVLRTTALSGDGRQQEPDCRADPDERLRDEQVDVGAVVRERAGPGRGARDDDPRDDDADDDAPAWRKRSAAQIGSTSTR